ncbi:MAG: hypothetical protein ACMUEM_02405 [Flavobacteriales bacterium AspAUS03]
MEEKEYVIDSLESRLANKDRQIERKKVNFEHVIKEQIASFERVIIRKEILFEHIIVGRDKEIETLERQIEDFKINLDRLILEKYEVVKMKDAMLAIKDQMLEIQIGKISGLEDPKKYRKIKYASKALHDHHTGIIEAGEK